ncbi:nucleoside/nucleotide kinase family protein [Hoeflea sp. YIM 152468]|uniref:nucleoside/nucleotide kinase family protein n=1 Tax=Hoeflea sp. YIM 152468 TaxID=3031759 RepID=UPI0023DAF322|nr:nucleoside/nucleotide kinase family protein [Hoeflea sp. YIM 152468]MDF1606569.1 nucleoside/nucleotide kinase family protein [Hoeflea sp. YIM 152468]
MRKNSAARLAEAAIAGAGERERFILALAGPPGVGKSTLAEALVAEFASRGQRAAIVAMDGFHFDNAVLAARGTLPRKGAPFTFDVDGYAALLRRLRAERDRDIAVPVFDRALDLARAGGSLITSEHRFLIAEGNYLLLDAPVWTQIADLFDLTVMLKADLSDLKRRLIDRWLALGLNHSEAHARAKVNDIPNAELVLAASRPADLEISTAGEP